MHILVSSSTSDFSRSLMPENEYLRASKDLPRAEFALRWKHPFLVFGELGDDWNFEFKTKSIGPQGWDRFLSSEEKLKRTTQTDVPSREDKDDIDDLGGIIAITKSTRNPYSDRISIGRARTC